MKRACPRELICYLILTSFAAMGFSQEAISLDSIVTFSVSLEEGAASPDTITAEIENFLFDDEERLIEKTKFIYDEMGFPQPSIKYEYEYTSDGSIRIEFAYKEGEWVKDDKRTTVLTDTLYMRISEEWDSMLKAWIGYERIIQSFNEYGISTYVRDIWIDDAWISTSKRETTYDILGRADSREVTTGVSTKKTRFIYQDTTSLLLGDTTYILEGQDFVYDEAQTRNYLPGSNLISKWSFFKYDEARSTWDSTKVFEYEFDANGNQTVRRWYDFTSRSRKLINVGYSEYLRDSLLQLYDEYSFVDNLDTLVRTLLVTDEYDDEDRPTRKTWHRSLDGQFRTGFEILIGYREGLQRSFYQYRPYLTETELEKDYDFDIYHYGQEITLALLYPTRIEPIQVFPNPAHQGVRVLEPRDDIGFYRWYDIMGKFLGQGKYDGSEIQLPGGSAQSQLILMLSDKKGRDMQMTRVLRR